MLVTEEAVVVGTDGGLGQTGVPTTTAAAAGAGVSGLRAGVNGQQRPDPAVPEKPVRRRFDAEYKARILREADQLTEPGQVGALLRREGLYSSHLSVWRTQRDEAALAGLVPKRRGRKPDPNAELVAGNQRLVRENAKLMRKLRRTEAILDVQKTLRDPGDRTAATRLRERAIKAIEELAPAVGTSVACAAVGVPRATVYRHRQPKAAAAPKPRPAPPRALSGEERKQVLVLHSESFADKAPAETYENLLDQGTYLCSIRTMYRVLKANQKVRERRNQLRHPGYAKPQLVATAPNQVWTWDITKLLGPVKWTYYYLYVILDIYSWYVVGWMLAHHESQHLAERLIRETLIKEGIHRGQLTIHSDRGPAMRSQAVAQLLATLGVTKSHSRHHVSDDNPFSESQFKTIKYRPNFPDRFAAFDHGLDFCRRFFNWREREPRVASV